MANARGSPGNFHDLTGKRFGRLTVISRDGTTKCGNAKWKCVCDCGKITNPIGSSLERGETKSCGCLARENAAKRKPNKTHGCSDTRLYRIWTSMNDRCRRKSFYKYNLYGGRGITVCDEWRTFEPFRDWAVKSGYNANAKRGECTLDRIDQNGNYEPLNCRWVSYTQQNRNKRTNVNITYNGITKTAAEWGYALGGNRHCVLRRLQAGWDEGKAVSTPLRRKK